MLEDLDTAIAGLDPEGLADPESIKALYASLARMEAKVAKAIWRGGRQLRCLAVCAGDE